MASADVEKHGPSAKENRSRKSQDEKGSGNATSLQPSGKLQPTANGENSVYKSPEANASSSSSIEIDVDETAPPINDPDVVDWDGEDDPANPMNWKRSAKFANVGLISAVTFV